MRMPYLKGAVALATLAFLSGCARSEAAAAPPFTTATALPSNAQFASKDLSAIVPPDESLRLGSTGGAGSSPLTSNMNVLDCSKVGNWLGIPIPTIPGYVSTCGTINIGAGLPERHGHIDVNGENAEYTVEVEYAPAGVDVTKLGSSEAFDEGAIDVALRYNEQSWNGGGFKGAPTTSNPTDKVNGGYVYGTINDRPAVVQQLTATDTRVATTVTIGGDVFLVSINSELNPLRSLAFAASSTLG